MEPNWSNRIWDSWIDAYYAKHKLDPDDNLHWTLIASKRYWAKDGKWYGL